MARRGSRSIAVVLLLGAVVLVGAARRAAADYEAARTLFQERVKSAEWKERRTAYLGLSDYDGGPAAALVLQGAGGESHVAVLEGAASVLSKMKTEAARAAAVAALRKGKGTERTVAATALAGMTGADADAVLVETLASGPPHLAVLSATALGSLGRTNTTAPLLAALSNSSPQVRAAAARALAAHTEKSADGPLVERLKSERGRTRADVVAALEAITGQKHGDALARWAAVVAGTDLATVHEEAALAPTMLGVPVVGERVVFVLDRSLHMRDAHPWAAAEKRDRLEELCSPKDGARIPWRTLKTKLQLAIAHLRHAVEGLPSSAKYEVVYFAADVKSVFGLKWASASGANRKVLEAALPTIDVDDGINLYEALLAALDLGGASDDKAMKAGPDQIVLVTNNIPTKGDVTDADVLARSIAFRARSHGVAISVIGLGEHPYSLAEELAKRTGGVYANLVK